MDNFVSLYREALEEQRERDLDHAIKLLMGSYDPIEGSQDGGYPGEYTRIRGLIIIAGESGYKGTDLCIYDVSEVLRFYREACGLAREAFADDGDPEVESWSDRLHEWFPHGVPLEETRE